jgi:hypothetical protein
MLRVKFSGHIFFTESFLLDFLKSAMYKFGGLGKKYISPIGAESALFFSPKRIFLRENSFFRKRRVCGCAFNVKKR